LSNFNGYGKPDETLSSKEIKKKIFANKNVKNILDENILFVL
jgi:hypothetical protein